MSFKERLDQMGESWKTSREEKGGGFNDAFEDGVHAFKLQSLYLKESTSSAELQAVAEHYCTEGSAGGEVYTQWFNLEKANAEGKVWGQIFLAQLIEALGYETPENMGDLEEVLAQIAEAAPSYTARVKTSPQGFKNLTIVRMTDGGEAPAEDAAPAKPAARGGGRPPAAPPEEPAAEAPEEGGEPAEGDQAAFDHKDPALASFVEAWTVDISGCTSKEEITQTLLGFEWKASDLTPDEIDVLQAYKVPVKGAAPAKPAAPPKAAPKAAAPPPKPASKAAPARPAAKAPPKPAPRGTARPAGRR